jgi:hypothetical protein
MAKDLQTKYQICCFTERVDSMAMWAHYADGHKGFALEFDCARIALAGEAPMVWPVYYSESMFDATECFAQAYIDRKKLNPLIGIAASTCKSAEWAYETEWRSIIPMINGEPGQLRIFPKPKGIYIGLAAEANTRDRISAIALELRIPVYFMRPKRNSYSLSFEHAPPGGHAR